MKKLSLWLLNCTLIALLAACGATVEPKGSKLEQASVEINPSKETKAVEKVKTTSDRASVEHDNDTIAKIEEPAQKFEVPPASVLKGKSPDEILAVFGEPVLLRKDEPAQVWQYLTATCALHLVFYSENGAAPKVTFVAMNDRNKALKIKSEACFKSQLKRVGFERAQALS